MVSSAAELLLGNLIKNTFALLLYPTRYQKEINFAGIEIPKTIKKRNMTFPEEETLNILNE